MDGRYGRWDSAEFGVLYYEFQTFPTRIGCKVMVGVALGSGQGTRKLCV